MLNAIDIEEKAIKLSWVLRKELDVNTDMRIEKEILEINKKRNSKVAS